MWLMRWSRTRGFGIQSPWVYHFVQTVVRHSGIADERAVGMKVEGCTYKTLTLSMLYYRLARQAPYSSWEFNTSDDNVKRSAVASGRNGVADKAQDNPPLYKNQVDVWVVDIEELFPVDLQMFLDRRDPNRILIVEGIYHSKHSLGQWQKLRSDPSAGVSLDLYYCGIICFDLKMHKQCYKVMI